MAKKSQKVRNGGRQVAPRAGAGDGPGIASAEATSAATQPADTELAARFRKALEDVHEDITERLEAARRDNTQLYLFGLDIGPEVAQLKEYNAAIRKLVAALEELKRLINLRVDDLKHMRDLSGRAGR